eukprot:1156946-Karenia_brevis.AAC.1
MANLLHGFVKLGARCEQASSIGNCSFTDTDLMHEKRPGEIRANMSADMASSSTCLRCRCAHACNHPLPNHGSTLS